MIPRLTLSTVPTAAVAVAVAGAVLVAACGGAPPATLGQPSTRPSAQPSAPVTGEPSAVGLLLEVASEGGFINPAAAIGVPPQVVVETDGRIFVPATAPDGPQPLVPRVEVRNTGPRGADAILAAIRAAGLDTESSGGVAADTGSTVFTVIVDGETVVSRFATGAPGGPVGHGGPGPSAAPSSSRVPATSGLPAAPGAAAFALLARLLDPAETWGEASAPASEPFAPDAYLVYVAPAESATAESEPWPLATAPAAFGAPALPDHGVAGLRSGLVTGADARTLAAGLAAAPAGSLVASGGRAWSAWVRPVFPDEIGG